MNIPVYKIGKIKLIKNDQIISTYDIGYYYSMMGNIVPILQYSSNSSNISNDIKNHDPDSVIFNYPLRNSEAETKFKKHIGINGTIVYGITKYLPIIFLNNNNVEYNLYEITSEKEDPELLGGKLRTFGLNKTLFQTTINDLEKEIFRDILYEWKQKYVINWVAIGRNIIKYKYSEYSSYFDGMVIEKLVLVGQDGDKIYMYCFLDRNGVLGLFKYHSIINGSEYIKNIGWSPYKKLAIFLLVLAGIAAIITPILVSKYKK